MVDKFSVRVGAFAAPDRCHLCGLASRGQACTACVRDLPWNCHACHRCALPLDSATPSGACCADCAGKPPPQDAAWTAFTYRPPVSSLLLNLKFHGRLAGAHLLGGLMATRLATRATPMPELIVPVPLHRARLRARGYNQAGEVARELGRRLSIPVATALAQRRRATLEQTRLHAEQRRHNLHGAFEVGDVRGRHVALLDDVITTGATMAEFAAAARQSGARRIEAWAVARAE
ncbi:MAG TPA: ComF family protein [Verrucomicrobiae bacterium]|nr:ComF family protein [Verrucomicrobiae bacterium]